MVRRHVGQRTERAFENQRPGAVAGSQLDGHRAAQRFAHQNNVAATEVFPRHQPIAGRVGVGQHAGLARTSFAPAIAAIIEDEHRRPDAAMQHDKRIQAVRDVAAVAMAEQYKRLRILRGHVPTVQAAAVGRFKPNILERDAPGLPIALRIDRGEEDQRVFQKHGGHQYEKVRQQQDAAPAATSKTMPRKHRDLESHGGDPRSWPFFSHTVAPH